MGYPLWRDSDMLPMVRYCILPGTVQYGTVLTYSHSLLDGTLIPGHGTKIYFHRVFLKRGLRIQDSRFKIQETLFKVDSLVYNVITLAMSYFVDKTR